MTMEVLVRVSFNTDSVANQSVNEALVGTKQGNVGDGPFTKIGTALYQASGADDSEVGLAMAKLGEVLHMNAGSLDFVSIALARNDAPTEDQQEEPA